MNCDAELVLQCLLVDDSACFLKAATTLLEREGLAVVGVASTTADALALASELGPDVILVDVMLGGESGLDVARRLADADTSAKVILISTHAEADLAELIDQAPAVGFLAKSELSASMIRQLTGEARER
jgi:DNA-binding NarL/FixJ family response regulator